MKTITVPSDKGRLYDVQEFVKDCLSGCGASEKTIQQLELIVEEIFVNIVSYAYNHPSEGDISISCSVEEHLMRVTLTFTDAGPEFDPLSIEDPDVKMKMEDRSVGGLGLFLVKKNVDGITYRRDNGRNVLLIEKRLS